MVEHASQINHSLKDSNGSIQICVPMTDPFTLNMPALLIFFKVGMTCRKMGQHWETCIMCQAPTTCWKKLQILSCHQSATHKWTKTQIQDMKKYTMYHITVQNHINSSNPKDYAMSVCLSNLLCSSSLYTSLYGYLIYFSFILIALAHIQLYRKPSKRSESHNIQRLLVLLYCILMALLGARTPLLSLGKWGSHTFSHPYGGCVGKATMVKTAAVKTHGRQRELNPTSVEPPTIRHQPLEHACSLDSYLICTRSSIHAPDI
jgi:hypothetical protein